MPEYVHVVSCSAAGEVVAETLRRLGREEEIVEGFDSLHEGPIHDVDAGAASRVGWWARLEYGADVEMVEEPAEPADFDDADVWRELAARPTSVVIWHGPHPMEHAFMLRTSWYLREQPHRVHEVALTPSGKVWCGVERPAFSPRIESYPRCMIGPARGAQIAMFDAAGAVAPRAKKTRKRRRGIALGRKPRPDRVGFVPHTRRDEHDFRHPVHVSMRRVKLASSLRSERIFHAILVQLARVKRLGVRVVHYSVQHDHLHLIVEGETRHDLSAQMGKLFSRIALAVNAIAKRRGSLFRDRHHREELDGPTKTRNALVYVLFNDRKHHAQNGGAIGEEILSELDDRSSAAWLDGWDERARPPPEGIARIKARYDDIDGLGSPRIAPQTWLAELGWRVRGRGGAIKLHELPRFV